MACPAPARAAARPVDGGRSAARAQRVLALLLLGAVVALDQATKAWAWRHVPGSFINAGSGLGGPVNVWFAGSSSGAALDVVDTVGLCAAGLALVRVPRRPAVLVSAALMIAGWGSNLLDRLGLHGLTAPGSVRGAVDFIRVGRLQVNVADLVITAATAALVVLVVRSRRTRGTAAGRREAGRSGRRLAFEVAAPVCRPS